MDKSWNVKKGKLFLLLEQGELGLIGRYSFGERILDIVKWKNVLQYIGKLYRCEKIFVYRIGFY